jgi:hypothetical protein
VPGELFPDLHWGFKRAIFFFSSLLRGINNLPDPVSRLPPAAKNLFEKRFLDFQKLFIRGCFGHHLSSVFSPSIFVSLCVPLWLKLGGGFWIAVK